jgi:hypothetical protein
MADMVQIRNNDERPLPLPRSVSILFVLRDENGVPIEPDSVDSITVYRVSKSPEQQADPSAYVFLKKINSEDGSKPIWSIDDQAFASGVVTSGKVEFTVDQTQLQDGANHDFSDDILLLGGERCPISPERVLLTGATTFTVTIDVGDLVANGTPFEMTWAKRAFDKSIRRYAPGTFEYLFDSAELRFGPGSYFSLIEFTKGADNGTGAVEFFFDRELAMAQSSLAFRRERLRDTTKNKIPFFYFDLENFDGSQEHFKTQDLIGYFNEVIAREYDLVDGISYIWDPLTAPVLVLDHIAAEYGFKLVGLDQKKWRDQVIYATDRLKQKGTVKGLRNRLEDCGAGLEDFSSYYQVRSQKFSTQAWIINPLTESELLVEGATARTFRFPLDRPPWHFPYGRERRDTLVPFTTLEVRAEGEERWIKLPAREGNFLLVRFEEEDGKWYANVTLDKLKQNTFPPVVEQIVEPYRLNTWDEVRITYPTAPWGLVPSTLDFHAEQTWPDFIRSGPASFRHQTSGKLISLGEPGGLPSLVLHELTATGPVELEVNSRPPARRGYAVIWYQEHKALVFGGIDHDGKYLNDTWLLDFDDLSNITWSKYDGPSPSARAGATVLDTHDDTTPDSLARWYIFGGVGRSGTFSDTWRWNSTSIRWESVNPSTVSTGSNYVFGDISAGDIVPAVAGNIESTTGIRKGHVVLFETEANVKKRFALRITDVVGSDAVGGVVLWVDSDYGMYYSESSTFGGVGTGTQNLTISPGLGFLPGHLIVVSLAGSPANYMVGKIIAYNSTTGAMSFNSVLTGGSGFGLGSQWLVGLVLDAGVMNLHPSPRAAAGAVSIPVDAGNSDIAHAFMFGGMDQRTGPLDEVWALEYSGRWTQIWPGGLGPTRGYMPTMLRVQSNESGNPWQLYARAGSFDGGKYSDKALRSPNSLSYYHLDGLSPNPDPQDANDTATWLEAGSDLPNYIHARPAAVASGYASQHKAANYAFEYSLETGVETRRPKGSYQIGFDQLGDNRLEMTGAGFDVFPETISEVTRPVAEFGLFETGVKLESYFTKNTDVDRMTVSSQSTVSDTWRFTPQNPQRVFVQRPLDDEAFWNITPANEVFNERRLAVPLDSEPPSTGSRKHLLRFKTGSATSFAPSANDVAWSPVAQPDKRYKLLMRVFNPSGGLVAYAAVEDIGASRYAGTSSSNFSVSVGSKVFVTQADLAYAPSGGESIRISVADQPSIFMDADVIGYGGGNLEVLVTSVSGSGTYDNWNISITSAPVELKSASSDNIALGITVQSDGASDAVLLFSDDPLLVVDLRWRKNFLELPPISGSYAAIDDSWYQLVASTDGEFPRLTLTDRDGENFILESSDFAFVHNPNSNESQIWMKGAEPPELEGIVKASLKARYPARSYMLPPGVWEHRASWRVDPYFPKVLGENKAVIATTYSWKDDLLLEPAVYWGDLEVVDEGYRQAEDRKRLVDRWKMNILKPDGTIFEVSHEQIRVEKIYHNPGYYTEVRAVVDDDIDIPNGSIVHMVYPAGRVVILDNFDIDLTIKEPSSPAVITTDEAKRFGFGDYFRRLTGDSVAEFSIDESNTHVSLRPASIASLGRPQDIVPAYILACQSHLPISSKKLDRQPFFDTVAYDPIVDKDWTANGRVLWDSHELASVVGSEIDPLTPETRKVYKREELDDLPEFSSIYAVSLYHLNGSVPYAGRGVPSRLGYPVATISYQDSLRDLLHISLLQGRVPISASAAVGLEDWLDLYVLSLPRADVRVIDRLRTYKLWRKKLLAGEEPTVMPSPRIDHETRLIDIRDENLKNLCGDRQPFPGKVHFGHVRSEVVYGRTVFNTDEYDGSTRPSNDPCDIDESFVEPCSCSPSSHIGYVVTAPIAGSVTIQELREVISEMLPAHAIQRFGAFRSKNDELVPRPKERIVFGVKKHMDDVVLTFDPRRMPNGTKIPNPLWDALQKGSFAPFYSGDHWIQPDTSKGVEWLLEARQFANTSLPFAGIDYAGKKAEKAFALVMNRTKRLRGVSRFDETGLVFREEFNGSPDPETDFEIFNEITPSLSMEVAEVSDRYHVTIQGLETNAVVKGDYLVFAFGPDSSSALYGDATLMVEEVLAVLPGQGGPFYVIDESSSLMDLINTGSGPKAIAVSTTGQVNRSSLKILAERNHSNPNASHAGKLSIEPATQQEGYGANQPLASFKLLARLLRKCLVFTARDVSNYPELSSLSSHPNLYDPSGIGAVSAGDKVDGVGSIYYGQVKALDFIIVNGNIKAYRFNDFQTNISSASITDDQEIEFIFATPVDRMVLRNFVYVAARDNSTQEDVEAIRPTTAIIQRSTDRELDLMDGHFLFYEWTDAPSTWSKGGVLSLEQVRIFKVANEHFEKYDLQIGDFVFRNPDNLLEPFRIVEIAKGGTDVFVATSGQDISGNYDGLIAREVLSSIVSGKDGAWERIARHVSLGLDITSVMPAGYASETHVPSLVRIRVKDDDYSVSILSSETPAGNVTQVRLNGAIRLSQEPFSPSNEVEVVVFDPAASLAAVSATKGGSFIKVRTFALIGKLIETQEFN